MPFEPIENYGVIGDLHTVALVGTTGTIDWYCCPAFDSPSVFGCILDVEKGGYYALRPDSDEWQSKQLYFPDTNILITRFFYIRSTNPRTIAYTGVTRDGTFLIENGKVTRPVNNFRFNQSITEMLANIQAIGRPMRVAGEDGTVGAALMVPPMLVRDFNLTSVSDAV